MRRVHTGALVNCAKDALCVERLREMGAAQSLAEARRVAPDHHSALLTLTSRSTVRVSGMWWAAEPLACARPL